MVKAGQLVLSYLRMFSKNREVSVDILKMIKMLRLTHIEHITQRKLNSFKFHQMGAQFILSFHFYAWAYIS